jgi:hypothetical protein
VNEAVFKMYMASKKNLEQFDADGGLDGFDDDFKNVISDLKLYHTLLEEKEPAYKERYDRIMAMQKSFTPEQRDFICYQIGDWYCEWQDKMWVDDKPNQHWLGRGKEDLKTMICGD